MQSLRNIIFLLFALVIAGCSPFDPYEYIDDDEFEMVFTVLFPEDELKLYRSARYVGVKFAETVTPGYAEFLAREYSLTPVTMFHHFPGSGYWEERLSHSMIIMKIPGGATPDNYLSNYPRAMVRSFGDRPDVLYCLPTFATDLSGEPASRIYIDDIIVAYSRYEWKRIYPYIKKYNLELVEIEDYDWMEHIFYTFRVTSKSPGNSLEIANILTSMEIFIWAVADKWQYFTRDP
jgi:hypothetical protein